MKNYLAMLVTLALGSAISLAALGCQSQAPYPTAATQPPTAAPTKATTAAPTSPPAQPVATQAPAPTAAPETLKVGLMASMTGPGAVTGLNVERFLRMSLDDVNSKGGVKVAGKTYRLEGVTLDNKGTSDGGREAANRAILAEKIRFLLASGSSITAGAQPVTEPAKVLMLASSAPDRSLGSSFPLTFQTATPPFVARAGALYDWLSQEYPNVKRVAIVQPDDATGHSTADLSEKAATSRGATVVAKEFYPVDTKDFSPLVTRLLRQNPDGVETAASDKIPLFLGFLQALNEQGFKGRIYGTTGYNAPDLPKFLEGFAAASLFDWKAPVVGNAEKELFQRYIQKYGDGDLQFMTQPVYNLPMVLVQAVEKAGTVEDTEKIAQTLRDGEWETLWSKQMGKSRFVGVKTYGLASVMEQALYFSKVENGKAVAFKMMKATLP